MSYENKEFQYTKNHKCVPNGFGDYQMVCSNGTVLNQFVPFLMRSMLKGICSNCYKPIELLDEQRDTGDNKVT